MTARYSSDVHRPTSTGCRLPGSRSAPVHRTAVARPPGAGRGPRADGRLGRLPLGPACGRRRLGAPHGCRARPRGRGHRGGPRSRRSRALAIGDLVVLVWTAPCGTCAGLSPCRALAVCHAPWWRPPAGRGPGARASPGRQPGRRVQRCGHACHAPGRGRGGRDPWSIPHTPRRGRAPGLCRDHRHRCGAQHGWGPGGRIGRGHRAGWRWAGGA